MPRQILPILPSQEKDTTAGVCAPVGPRASAELSTIGYPAEIHPHTPTVASVIIILLPNESRLCIFDFLEVSPIFIHSPGYFKRVNGQERIYSRRF